MKVTILGCGTSSGVPQIGCTCAICTSNDPKNRRRRCSILVEAAGETVLFDTGPDDGGHWRQRIRVRFCTENRA